MAPVETSNNAGAGAGAAAVTHGKKPTVAVIGLGYGGIAAGHTLITSGKARVVGIDRGAAFYHRISAPFAMTEPAFADQLRLPYADMFKGVDGEFVQGTVARLEDKRVVLDDGRTVAFDYALVSTGSTYNGTIDPATRAADEIVEYFKRGYEALGKAKDVLVIGGGAAGVEYAAYIAAAFPAAKVTLVHGGDALFNNAPGAAARFKADIRQKLTALGVEIVLNEMLALPKDEDLSIPKRRTLTSTVTGRQYTSDVQIVAIGFSKINSEPFQASPWAAHLTKGGIKVNSFLQVEGVPQVFAAGDVANVQGPSGPVGKMAGNARFQATAAAHNILKLIEQGPRAELAPFTPLPFMMFVALGPHHGTTQGLPLDQYTFTGVLGDAVVGIKARDFFLGMTQGYMNPQSAATA